MSAGQQTCARGCPGPAHPDPVLELALCVPCQVREHLHARRISLNVPRAVAAQVVIGADRAVRHAAATIADLRCTGQWLDLQVLQLQSLHSMGKAARGQEQAGGPVALAGSWRTLATVLVHALDWQVETGRRAIADADPADPDALELALADQQAAAALGHLLHDVRAQRRLTLPHETEVPHGY